MTLVSDLSRDVMRGLTTTPKALPSKLLYDDRGSQLFQQIMNLPEYYPTDCEMEILSEQSAAILARLQQNSDKTAFQVIELGAGDGTKTRQLLQTMLQAGVPTTYLPIDISEEANQSLKKALSPVLPQLDIKPITGEYFRALEQAAERPGAQRLVLFLGSNIGNFTYPATFTFLKQLRHQLQTGDRVMIGFDLRKAPQTILDAYNDKQGITRAFNLNLLQRLNRELDAHFDVAKFDFFPCYNPEEGAVRSFLVSLKKQVVPIDRLQINVSFEAFETIHTESSRKYSLQEINELAEKSGFEIEGSFTDKRHYFADVLWKAV